MARKDFSRIENDNSVNSDIAICERNEPGRAKDIMKCGVITIEKEKSVYEAIGILVERNISGLPVVDDTGLVGIISEKDVLKLLYDTEFLPGSVQDYMTKDVVSFDEEDSLKDISNCLMHNRFRRVPILHRGKLVGIISRADIIRANKERFKPKGPTEKSTNNGPLARDIMKCGLLVVKRQTPIYEAVEIIATRNITITHSWNTTIAWPIYIFSAFPIARTEKPVLVGVIEILILWPGLMRTGDPIPATMLCH